ncbi:MAG: hypothetical protein WC554_08090 [Clostridia bacterium]
MFYLSLEKIKPYAMCPKGPSIVKWFEDRFPEDMELPLIDVFNQFGDVHTVFCLRAVNGGPEFALDYARDCIKNVQHKFEDEFPDNPLFMECIAVVNLILMHRTDTLISSAKEAGHNMELFCNSHHTNTSREREQAIKAGLAASRVAYAAYTLSQSHASVDYSLGAIEEARDAADNAKLEDIWQSSHLKELLLAHKDEHSSNSPDPEN